MAKHTCSVEGCERPYRAKGYCGGHYNQYLKPDRHRVTNLCRQCGQAYQTTRTNGKYCSLKCRDNAARAEHWGAYRDIQLTLPELPNRPNVPTDMRSDLRRAIEDGGDVISIVKKQCEVSDTGCWEWQGALGRDGYPRTTVAGKVLGVHRLTLEAKLGKPLGKQPAHHMCANIVCVNPDHLQAVTHRENAAEMLSRNYMVTRIKELEAALSSTDPSNPLLQEVGVPEVRGH